MGRVEKISEGHTSLGAHFNLESGKSGRLNIQGS